MITSFIIRHLVGKRQEGLGAILRVAFPAKSPSRQLDGNTHAYFSKSPKNVTIPLTRLVISEVKQINA
jgi:hypothetical protein